MHSVKELSVPVCSVCIYFCVVSVTMCDLSVHGTQCVALCSMCACSICVQRNAVCSYVLCNCVHVMTIICICVLRETVCMG